MFLKPRRATQGAVAIAAVGAFALTGCTDNEARTDLRPEGPPDVLAVLVLNDSVGGLVEAATYCKAGDEKRPSLVGLPDFTTTVLCPEDPNETQPMAEDASPDTFYVRIMFDELLDPSIEDLLPILDDNGLETGSFTGTLANTQPVTLQCTGVDGELHDVPYDGYYSPSGNAVTWPVGPSLVIKQVGDFIIPTNSECRVTLKDNIRDKQGELVPADQRGPFTFKVSGLKPVFIDPADDTTIDAIQLYFDNPYFQFNSIVDPDSMCLDEDGSGLCEQTAFDITPHVGGYCNIAGQPACETDADCGAGNTCEFFYSYRYDQVNAGTATEFGFGPANPVETEKTYTVTLKEGAVLRDQCDAPTTLGAPSVEGQTSTTVTTRKFGLRNATPIAPNNGDTVSGNRKVNIAFNNVIDFASLDLTEWSITPEVFIPATATVCTDDTDCTGFRGGGGQCRPFPAPINAMRCVNHYATTSGNDGDIIFRGVFAMNTEYTFTLNAGATVLDAYGKVFTNETAREIKFKTQPAIAITASAPANGATITKGSPTSLTTIQLAFNQAMDLTTLTADDYTITPAVTLNAPIASSGTGCTASGTSCTVLLRGVYPPGTYTFTLKAGAVIKDLLGNDYTQAADRTIQFTVEEAPPAPVRPCLGA